MASMAVLLSCALLLPLFCTSLFAVCRDFDSAANLDNYLSNHRAASVWPYGRSPYDDEPRERYGEQYSRHRRQEPAEAEEEERSFEDEGKTYAGYGGRSHYQPKERGYIEDEEKDRTEYHRPYYHGRQPSDAHYQKPREDREPYAYEPEARRSGEEEERRYERPERRRYEPEVRRPGDEEERSYERPDRDEDEESYRMRHGAHGEQPRERREQKQERFVLDDRWFIQQTIASTDAGEMAYILPRDVDNEFARRMIGLSIITLEPNALLLPHYTNTHCLFVVCKGKGRFSWVNGDDLQETDIEEGDVYKIESGTLFHLINTGGQKMQIFGIHDMAPGSTRLQFHAFFVAGGWNLGTVLSGFDDDVLTAAFNVSGDEVYDTLGSRIQKPIIYIERNESKQEQPSQSPQPSEGEKPEPSKSKKQTSTVTLSDKGNDIKREIYDVASVLLEDPVFPRIFENTGEKLEEPRLPRVFKNAKKDTSQKPFNILQKKPIFNNEFGTTTVADENDFEILQDVNKGVFSVKLKAGAILAPHWNPRAMEIAVVTEGKGEIHIVYPDGREAYTGRLNKGIIFYVPQNFVMCQLASRDEVLEFMGFSTSSEPNNPQFLAGSNSVLRKLNPDVLASSFNIPVEHVHKFLDKQQEAVVLPGESEQTEHAEVLSQVAS